jgi:hypothetical protein
MKPRTQLYRILARCKAAKHGPSQKAIRNKENARIAQELNEKHEARSVAMSHTFKLLYGSDW